MQYSWHAKTRMDQRGINNDMVAFLFLYGEKKPIIKAQLTILGRKHVPLLKKEKEKIKNRLSELKLRCKFLLAKKLAVKNSYSDLYNSHSNDVFDGTIETVNNQSSVEIETQIVETKRKMKKLRKKLSSIQHLIDKNGIEAVHQDGNLITVYKKTSRHCYYPSH